GAALAALSSAPDAAAAKRRIDGAGAAFAKQAARDAALMGAIGFPLDAATQAFVAANVDASAGAHADAATMAQLNAAAQRHAVGEPGLLAVIASGPGPARLDTASLISIIGALRQAGLDAEARQFAAEAILAGAPAGPVIVR